MWVRILYAGGVCPHPRQGTTLGGSDGWGMTAHPGPADHDDMKTPAQDSSANRRRFRIRVAGRLEARFAEGVPGIEIGESPEGTMLEGPLIDQSQLRGVVERLWRLGIEVLTFETYVADPEATDT